MQFTHVLFDMDGTLVDSMGYWDDVCGEWLRSAGLYSEELFDILKPMTLPQTAEYLESNFNMSVPLDEVVQRMYSIMQVHYEKDVELKAGVRSFLDEMQKKGVRMCVVSSTHRSLVELCLKRHNLTDYFEFVLSAEEVGKGKTDPDIYLEAAKRLGAEPQNCLVFEDAMAAGLTARRAGFLTAAIYDDNSDAAWDAFRTQTDLAFRDWDEARKMLR